MQPPRDLSPSDADRWPVPTNPDAAGNAAAGESVGLLTGYQLGPYRLLERLGGGIMATVYRAIDTRNSRRAAIKVLLPDADAVVRERFRHEARTHSKLSHPNIVPILDVGQEAESGITYLVMDLVDGPSLADLIEEHGTLAANDAARLLGPIAMALDYAHRQGVIHRDVKPSNVLLRAAASDEHGGVQIPWLPARVVPLLADFGIARALDAPELTSAGRTIGTPTYMSPEQCADSHELDGRSDLYALGAVFYRCIVGRPPFTGSTTQILHAHVYEPLLIPESISSAVPPSALEILKRTLAKDPVERYANGREMARELERLAVQPAPARPQPPPDDTATMPAIKTVRPTTSMQVLVPAPPRPPTTEIPASVEYARSEPFVAAPASPASAPRGRSRRRWTGMMLGGALAALVLVFAVAAVATVLPFDLFGLRLTPRVLTSPTAPAAAAIETPASTPTLVSSPDATTAEEPLPAAAPTTPAAENNVEPSPAPVATSLPPTTAADTSATETSATETSATETPVPETPATTNVPSPVPSVLPTPVGAAEDYFTDALAAYADSDWQGALDYLTLVRRIDPEYEPQLMEPMLFDIRLGLAAQAIANGKLEEAAKQVDEALVLRPDTELVRNIRRGIEALIVPNLLNRVTARWNLANALTAYAQTLGTAEAYCAAAEQLQAAAAVLPDSDVLGRLGEYQAQCLRAQRLAALEGAVQQLSGRLLYSTQEGDRYLIYQAPARREGPSGLLIADGAQPARQRSGPIVAFHSTRPSDGGIVAYNLFTTSDPNERTQRITTVPEDARDAPPSWSPDNLALVYASTSSGDRRSRIYLLNINKGGNATDLGLGKDPAFNPIDGRIIYNGVNNVGSEPGLWMMAPDGSSRVRLTDNGNDMRPAWTPDGRYVVFMSTRNGNWDLYRVGVEDGSVMQLTESPAQDGLPTVSPDGRYVAFASDREGFWRIYVVSIAGGPEIPLLTINGVLTNWLEHTIQWIP